MNVPCRKRLAVRPLYSPAGPSARRTPPAVASMPGVGLPDAFRPSPCSCMRTLTVVARGVGCGRSASASVRRGEQRATHAEVTPSTTLPSAHPPTHPPQAIAVTRPAPSQGLLPRGRDAPRSIGCVTAPLTIAAIAPRAKPFHAGSFLAPADIAPAPGGGWAQGAGQRRRRRGSPKGGSGWREGGGERRPLAAAAPRRSMCGAGRSPAAGALHPKSTTARRSEARNALVHAPLKTAMRIPAPQIRRRAASRGPRVR